MILIVYLDLLDKSFEKYNYNSPQPLIKIFGINIIEWILNNINIENFSDIIFLYNDESYNIENSIKVKYKNDNFIFTYFNSNSNIISAIIKTFENFDFKNDKQVLYLDTKNFYYENINNILLNNINNNIIFYINEEIENSKNIYINIEHKSYITRNKISNNIIVGLFYINSLNLLNEYCEKLINLNDILFINNELSIIQIINLMISENINFIPYKLNNEDIINLETPFHIRLFCNNFPKINAINNKNMIYKKKLCFELNDILTINRENYKLNNIENYKLNNIEHYKLNNRNIEFLKYLKKLGNIIIINTCIFNDNEEEIFNKEEILKILLDNNIIYDEIYFDKHYADFYIDSKNIILDKNIEKQLGFYNNKIDSRDFNDIVCKDIKTYKKISEDLSGEINYYLNIPSEIKDIFPIMFNYDTILNKWYEMENINGIPVSHLYLNEELTIEQLDNIMGTINRIHNCQSSEIELNHELNIYNNYSKKLKKRYKNYDYSQFQNSNIIYNFLLLKLEEYEENKLGKLTMIHGDPVFTNILINRFGKIKLIDMRGSIDNILTIYGDKLYDIAKIYQSIIGYDEILENKKVSEYYKNNIKLYFENKFINTYSEKYFYYLKIITASLLFTLIPLHNNDKCIHYYNLITSLDIL